MQGIIEKIASGRSLADALRQPGMPSYALAKATLRDNAELRELYEQAKANGWFVKKDKSDLVQASGLQDCTLEYPGILVGRLIKRAILKWRLRVNLKFLIIISRAVLGRSASAGLGRSVCRER